MIGKSLRRLVIAAALPVLMLSSAQAALADSFTILPAGLACPDFNLGLAATGGNLQTKDFVDDAGNPVKSITAGKGVVLTYTNYGPDPLPPVPVAGKSITIRTDGSVAWTKFNPDGTSTVTATGHNGLIMFPTDVPAGPTTTQYIGRIVYNVAANGVFTLVSTAGSQRDICAELG